MLEHSSCFINIFLDGFLLSCSDVGDILLIFRKYLAFSDLSDGPFLFLRTLSFSVKKRFQ